MENVIGTEINSLFFSYNKETNCFIAEASDLPKDLNFLSQIWNDACDEGFVLVSEKTEKKKIFYLTEIDRHGEELAGWKFSVYSTRSDNKIQKSMTALIIND